jgi:ABC-type Fe3+-siderophore transport system permease subunit
MAEPKKRTDPGMDTTQRSERSEAATRASVTATDAMNVATQASLFASQAANESTMRQTQSTQTVRIVYVVAVVAIAGIGAGASVLAPDQTVPIVAFCGSIIVALIPLMKGQSEVHSTVNSKMDLLIKEVEKSALAKGEATGRRLQKSENESA